MSAFRGTSSLGTVLLRSARIAAIGVLSVACLLLLIWPLVDGVLPPSTPDQLLGVVVLVLAGLVAELGSNVAALQAPRDTSVRNGTIAETVRLAARAHPRARRLRVISSTTETLLPAIRESGVRAELCEVLVQDFTGKPDPKSAVMLAKTEGLIRTWGDLPRQGLIGHVVVRTYDYLPLFFAVIFDEEVLVLGLFVPSDLETHVVYQIDPTVVVADSAAKRKLVQDFVRQFDQLCAPLPPYLDRPGA